jgi:hypothetical protein
MESLKSRDLLGDEAVDGRILLKWAVEKYGVRVGGGWKWLRIVFNEGLF